MAKKKPAPENPAPTGPQIEMFKDDGEPGSGECIGLVLMNASIIEHREGQLVPAIRLTTPQARVFLKKLFALIVEIDSDPPD